MNITQNVSLRPYCTLRSGGLADEFLIVRTVDELATAATFAFANAKRFTTLGWGSNVLPADNGAGGITCVNATRELEIAGDGRVTVDSGHGFQELFIKAAQQGLTGFEFAVGIPGTVGGGLVSNAGAYRSNISERLEAVELVDQGERKWVAPTALELSYRDSILRRPNPPAITLLRLRFQLNRANPKDIYDLGREYQRQRIGKQPPSPSAGSFFKNVNDAQLAASLESLPDGLKAAGVVPAGYLLEAAGMKGRHHKGAQFSHRHANFLMNTGGASAHALRSLAEHAKVAVFDQFGVTLEEEALFLGRWEEFVPDSLRT